MSRKFERPSLPPLAKVLKSFRGFAKEDNKRGRVLERLRKIVAELRRPENFPFYSMREMAAGLAVPLRTVAIAYQKLESEGLLLRLRGSHTQLLGFDHGSQTKIAGAVGLMLSIYSFRHYVHHRAFARQTGDALWKQSVIIDNVFFWDGEDSQSDFSDRLLRHHFDFAVWFQPLTHNRECILLLRDRGIRTLAISDAELHVVPAEIQIKWDQAYLKVLRHWKLKYQIEKIALPEEGQRTPARQQYFEAIARSEGLECLRFPSTPDIATRLAKPGALPNRCAIALLDEMGTVEFCLRDPQAFQFLAKHHRILFGRDLPSIPFAAPNHLHVERLVFPMEKIMHSCSDILTKWRAGEFESPPVVLAGIAELNHTHRRWM